MPEVVQTAETTEPKGTVIRQIPECGPADQGDNVIIYFSIFEPAPEPEPTPDPTETPPTETPPEPEPTDPTTTPAALPTPAASGSRGRR